MSHPEFSLHAWKRWQERCAGLDPALEWATTKCATPKQLGLLRKLCPAHVEQVGRAYRGFWYAVSQRSRVVFVIGSDKRVVTVFRWET